MLYAVSKIIPAGGLLAAGAIVLGSSIQAYAQTDINLVEGDLIQFNDNGSWSWFSEERAIVDPTANLILVGSIGDKFGAGGRDGSTEIAYFNVDSGSSDRFVLNPFLGSQGGNDHAHPVLDQLADGRYIAAYANHGLDSVSRFRVSTNPHDPTSWSNEVTVNNTPPGGGGVDGSTTYSNVFQLTGNGASEQGRLYNFNRSRGFDPNFNTSTDGGKTWQYGGRLLNDNPADPNGRNSTRPYANYTTNGVDEIHFINTDNHPNNQPISNLYHGVIRGGKVYDSFGNEIDGTLFDINGSLPSAPTRIFQGTTGLGGRSAWGSDIELDANGHPVVAFTTQVNNSGADLRYHYARFDGTEWHTNEIAFAGRNALLGQTDYTGNISLDPNDLNTVYIAADVDPTTGQALISKADGEQHFEIFKGVTTDNGKTFGWTQVTKDSAYDNLRPIVPDWDEDNTAVIWMRGLYGLPGVSGNYDRGAGFLDYDLAIVGLVEQAELSRGKIKYVDANTGNTTLANGGNLVTTTGNNTGADDDRWHRQTSHGNNGYVYAAGDNGGDENAPTIRTTVTNDSDEGTFDVFAYFWSDGDQWAIQAGFAADDLTWVREQGAEQAEAGEFVNTVVTADGDLRLYQAYLGRVELDADEDLSVYVGLGSGMSASAGNYTHAFDGVTHYDGIGLARVSEIVPEPGCLSLLSVAGLTLLRRSR